MALFDDIQNELLYDVWDDSYSPDTASPFPLKEAASFIKSLEVSTLVAKRAVEDLVHKGYIQYSDGYHEHFEISINGIREVEAAIAIPGSAISKISEQLHSQKSVPAADRFVTLNHNSADYISAVQALRDIRTKAPTDNEFCDLVADENDRALIYSEIDSAITLLASLKVRAEAFDKNSYLVRTLTWLADKLVGNAIGQLAKNAVDYITKLFGS